jgi:thiamine biosynthesis protein ThiS
MNEIVLNGEVRQVENGATVQELLLSLGIDPARVAVELDREILKPGRWAETVLGPGAKLEIVHFVGGGSR